MSDSIALEKVAVADLTLNKAQLKRLRHYFSMGVRASKYELDGIDLDLCGHGLVTTSQSAGYSIHQIQVTNKGIALLHANRTEDIARRSVHHSLGNRLAEFLRNKGRMTWENIEFKNWVTTKRLPRSEERMEYNHWQHVRPDVFSIVPTLTEKRANPCVHEVKVSRADFFADIAKPEKREAYAMMAEQVYYVAPAGIIMPSDVPDGFGLMEETEEGVFVVAKRAKKNKVALQPWHYLNMILKPGQKPDED